MKRTGVAVLLTLISHASSGGVRAQALTATDIEVLELVPTRNGAPARLCPGPDNALRVGLTWHGAPPGRPVSLRLELIVPGGAATLVAEGSASFPTRSTLATFTFLRVEVPARLRGRGARLLVRANSDLAIPEPDLTNDTRPLPLDPATDWSCRSQ